MTALPAYDLAAEQSLLGSVLAAPDLATAALLTLETDGFWSERHQKIATVLRTRITRGDPIDPQLVLQDAIGRPGMGDDIGAYLLTLYQRAWTPANADLYAERIRSLHAARRLLEVVQRTDHQLRTIAQNLDDVDLTGVVKDLTKGAELVAGMTAPAAIPDPPTVLDLLAETETYDWLVPGLLERSERVLLTGAEGGGKSTLITQMTACFAGGIHPFTRGRIKPLRVAVVDCENPRQLARRRYRSMLPKVDNLLAQSGLPPGDWGNQLYIEFRPDGLDLLKPKDVAWLESWCVATAPDVLILGPIYKLHATNINDELAARELTRVLDSVRTRHGCALISEAHAGNAEDSTGRRVMRPIGSSLFRRWPEFGFGMVRVKPDTKRDKHGREVENDKTDFPGLVDMVAWRGSREERDWPKQMQHGLTLPWVPHGDYRPTGHLEIA